MHKYEEIEKSIIKKYRKDIWCNFTKAVREYKLINNHDKIAVCISGGKDSFLLAKCIDELSRHGKVNFEVVYIVMNPGYNKKNTSQIIKNAKILNIPIAMFEAPIFDYVTSLNEGSPCYMCARMRRGYLYSMAQELGCNKIALGHHFNDVIETTLLSMLYGSEIKTMMPKLHSKNFNNMQLIRPLYFVREKSIISWQKSNNLTFLNCACKYTQDSKHDSKLSKRNEMKKLISHMKEINKNVDINIFRSLENINLDAVLGYKHHEKKHNFLDEYDK